AQHARRRLGRRQPGHGRELGRPRRRGRRRGLRRSVRLPGPRGLRASGRSDRTLLHWGSGLTGMGLGTPMDVEKVTTKRMALYSGRTHEALAEEVAAALGIELW